MPKYDWLEVFLNKSQSVLVDSPVWLSVTVIALIVSITWCGLYYWLKDFDENYKVICFVIGYSSITWWLHLRHLLIQHELSNKKGTHANEKDKTP